MKKIEVYDPALCCSTGVCGPNVDTKLVQFANDLAWLKEQGVSVERFNLGQQPSAFVENPLIKSILSTQGNESLPIILVNGKVATTGLYPTRAQLVDLVNLNEKSGCCGEEESGSCESEETDCCSDDSSCCK